MRISQLSWFSSRLKIQKGEKSAYFNFTLFAIPSDSSNFICSLGLNKDLFI